MTDYLVDTVAFVGYLVDRLPSRADRPFREAESGKAHLLLPQIALGEFLYLALRGRVKGVTSEVRLREVLNELTASDAFTISSMPVAAWETFLTLSIPELHDRMIAAEAISRGIPVISNDSRFEGVDRLSVIW